MGFVATGTYRGVKVRLGHGLGFSWGLQVSSGGSRSEVSEAGVGTGNISGGCGQARPMG